MSEVTFTPEQVKEIRRRIKDTFLPPFTSSGAISNYDNGRFAGAQQLKDRALAAFPLPKVTRYRTFRAMVDTYRVNGDTVEYLAPDGKTYYEAADGQSRSRFAQCLARGGNWTDLATFADICARPTEEVPDDGR